MSKVNFGKKVMVKKRVIVKDPVLYQVYVMLLSLRILNRKGDSSSTFIVHYFICTVKTDLGFWKFDLDFDVFCFKKIKTLLIQNMHNLGK